MVKALARLVGAVAAIKRVERREMAKAAEHFAGPAAASDDALRVREMDAQHAPADEADDGDEFDDENRCRSSHDAPLWNEAAPVRAAPEDMPPMDRLQMVADSAVSRVGAAS